MPPHFQPESRTLELAVADLLDPRLVRSIGFSSRGGFERMWLGQAIHGRYQEEALAADGSYRREVVLRAELDHKGWHVVISGRADGLRRDPDGTRVIEEIKSVRREGQLPVATRELYDHQAALYAWMLARSTGEPTRAELLLIAIGTDALERLPVEFDADAVEVRVRRRIGQLIHDWESRQREREDRRSAGLALEFPHGQLRAGQAEIVDAVEEAVEGGSHLLLEAPTGIGKTAAALWPALRHALVHDRRLFVLTAKNLQQEMAVRVLRMLAPGTGLHALRMRAKRRMCANGEVICHEDYCPFARDYAAKLSRSGIVQRLRDEEPVLEPDLVFSAAAQTEVCPFEISLDLAGRAQVVIADYNYAFDPWVALSDFGPEGDLSDTILVIDEAHNLVDRGRGYLSPELSARRARQAAESAAHGGTPVHRRVEQVALTLAATLEELASSALTEAAEGGDVAVETSIPEERLFALRVDFDETFIAYLEHQREQRSFRAEDPFVALYFELLRFLTTLGRSDDALTRLAERRDGDLLLRILCKDPSRHLAEVIGRTHSTIALSATLSPPEFYRDLLGFENHRTVAVSVADPFPPEHRRVVVDTSVSTAWRDRDAHAPRLAERLAAFADAVPGNCLALFPSYRFLSDVAGRMQTRHKRILVQQQADTERDREALLAALRGAVAGDVLLLAVAGGVFAEGVDYPGDMLRAVAVIGPCLPVPTLDQRLLQEYYEERFERGFEYAFVVPGMVRVVQAAGRLIRSATDTGVIALFDRRFLHRPFRHHLPPAWGADANSDNSHHLAGDPDQAARAFFAGLEAAAGRRQDSEPSGATMPEP